MLKHMQIRINPYKYEDAEIVTVIDDLARKRQLSDVIRDGIRLIVDLRAGHTDVLFALFPFVRQQLVQYNVPDNVPDKPAGLKPLKGLAAVAMPTFEDEEDTVIIRKDENAGISAAYNFVEAAMKIIQ